MTTQDDGTLPELAALLAAGLLRLSARKSSQKLCGEAKSLLDCGGRSEGDVARKSQEVSP